MIVSRHCLDDYFEKCGIKEDESFNPASSGLNSSLLTEEPTFK
jgi:hypothetical protein